MINTATYLKTNDSNLNEIKVRFQGIKPHICILKQMNSKHLSLPWNGAIYTAKRWWSPRVAMSACPKRREVVVWASQWRRGRSGNAIGLTKVARQSAMRAQHGPCCSHTEERVSDIRRSHSDLVDSLGRHGRSVIAVLCDGGFSEFIVTIISGQPF